MKDVLPWDAATSGKTTTQPKYHVYILVRDEVPYYVGVTTRPNGRYSKEKRADMNIVATFGNRHDAASCETFLISEYLQKGANLQNKKTITAPVRFASTEHVMRLKFSECVHNFLVGLERLSIPAERFVGYIILQYDKQLRNRKPFTVEYLVKNWRKDKFASITNKINPKVKEVLLQLQENTFDGIGKPLRHERRLKFSDEVNDFFNRMERDHGMPASNLADMLLKTCIPQFVNKRYTEEGIVGLWRQGKF